MQSLGRTLGRDTNVRLTSSASTLVMVVEAEHVQAKWVGRTVMRLASQVLVMEVEERQSQSPHLHAR